MAPDSMAGSPASWEFFERKRRLAYVLAWLSMALLMIEFSLGSAVEFYGHPRVVATQGGFWLSHHCPSRDEPEGSQILFLGADLRMRSEPVRLVDPVTALLPEGPELAVFYGSRGSVLSGGQSSKVIDLGQTWDVLGAVQDPGRGAAWIFGWNDGHLVARRREGGVWLPEIPVAASGLVERLSASMDGTAGPLVAWRERSGTRVRTLLYDGRAFVPGPEAEIGGDAQWDALRSQGRTVLVVYNRDDRSFGSVTLRLSNLDDPASAAAPRKVAFAEPPLLLGRRVTGLAAVASGDTLYFLITRPSTLMWASVRASTLEPDRAAARLAAIPVTPPWLTALGALTPILLVFCSLSLIFLGFILFRERTRILAEAPGTNFPPEAGLLARGMAYLLDLVLLAPLLVAVTEFLDTPLEEANDPRLVWIALVWLGMEFAYHFILEWRLGWTIGKGILGIRVAELDGSPVGLRGALVRNLLRAIDGQLPFSALLGVALMMRTRRCQRLGDLAARTVVLRDPGRRA